jgi:hypothetical protein
MADLKTLLGDAYKEGMTVDEINKALADKDLVDRSTLPKTVLKETFDKTASELAELKKKVKILEESSMTAEEKAKEAELKAKEYTVKLNRLEIEKLFVQSGLSDKEYNPILDGIVSDDLEKSKVLASSILTTFKSKITSAEQKVKEELLNNTPRTPAGEGVPPSRKYQKEYEEALARGDMASAAAWLRKAQEE